MNDDALIRNRVFADIRVGDTASLTRILSRNDIKSFALISGDLNPTHGVVACGDADGYPRVFPSGTPVLVHGVRCPMAGRVSMDMMTVDLTAVLQARIGSPVTLWGHNASGARLPIDKIAQAASTVGDELMCALAPRVPTRVESLRPYP
jgi:hypothetical protein